MSKAKKKLKRLRGELRECDALARELAESVDTLGSMQFAPELAACPPPVYDVRCPDCGKRRNDALMASFGAATGADDLVRERREARRALAWHVERLGGGDRDWGELLDEWRAATSPS